MHSFANRVGKSLSKYFLYFKLRIFWSLFVYCRLCNIGRVSFDAKRAMSAIGLFQDLRQAILNPKY